MIIMLLIAFSFALIPQKYFYRKYMLYENKLVEATDENEDNISTISKNNLDNKSISSKKSKRKTLFIVSKKLAKLKNQKYNYIKLLNDWLSLIKSKIYILSIMKGSINTFIFQIIHSYLTSYQETIFQECNEKFIVLFYNIANLVTSIL